MIRRREEDWGAVRNIGITGSGPGCGATTLGAAIACYFGRQNHTVSFTECKSHNLWGTLFFDSVDMSRRFKNDEFLSIYELVRKNQSAKQVRNIWENVNWRLYTSEDRSSKEELSDQQKWKLICSATGEICIFDFDSCGSWDAFLENMDIIIVVIDPLPSRLIRDRQRIAFFQQLDEKGIPIYIVINHMNTGVSRRQVKRIFKGERLFFLDHVPAAQVYASEFRCQPVWLSKEGKHAFDSVIEEIFSGLF